MKNDKKITIILLLLLVMVGCAGYGVYSYYWTQGTYGTNDNDEGTLPRIELNKAFYPVTYSDSDFENGSFIGGGTNNITLECVASSSSLYTCSGYMFIKNDSSSTIYLTLDSDETFLYIGEDSYSYNEDSYTIDNIYNFSVNYPASISSGNYSSVTVSISVPVGNNAVEVTEPVGSGSLSVDVYFDLIVSQKEINNQFYNN